MTEPIVVTKQIIEHIFDDAAMSYDHVGPSIFARFGARLVERLPLAPGAQLDIATGKGAVLLPAARAWGQRDALPASTCPVPYSRRQNAPCEWKD